MRSSQIATSALTKRKFDVGIVEGGLISALTAFAPSERARLIVARPIPEEPPSSMMISS